MKNRNKLKDFIVEIFKSENKQLETINFIFTTDKYLLNINKQFLKHNFLTDIITFELSKPDLPVIADVYISIDRIKENSLNLKSGFTAELLRVIFHGALHLCGYSDKTIMQKKIMAKRENLYLSRYFNSVSRDT